MFYERKINNDINIINNNGKFREISNNSYCSFPTLFVFKDYIIIKQI